MNLLANPRLRLFAGATMICFSPVWVRLVDVSPTTSGFYRVFFGGVALSLFLVLTRQRLQLTKRVWSILVFSAVFFALDLWYWHRSINYIGPGLSTLLANFQVFFMMLAGMVLLRQRPRPLQLIAVPLALSYMLTMRAARTGSRHPLPTREVAIVSLGSAAILGVSAFVEGASLAIPTMADATWLLAYGLVSHCLGLLLIASGLPHVSTTEAGLALLLQPTLSFIWDVLIFDRPLTSMEVAGALIALIAIYLGSKQRQRAA
jgi:drug/metabolite transporter (DMT)-like permease